MQSKYLDTGEQKARAAAAASCSVMPSVGPFLLFLEEKVVMRVLLLLCLPRKSALSLSRSLSLSIEIQSVG